jgi:hypothetical protein
MYKEKNEEFAMIRKIIKSCVPLSFAFIYFISIYPSFSSLLERVNERDKLLQLRCAINKIRAQECMTLSSSSYLESKQSISRKRVKATLCS